MSTVKLKASILTFLAAYAIGGLATEVLLPGREKSAIPLFSWFLFDEVPNAMQSYDIEVLKYDEREFDPPLNWSAADGVASPKGRELIQRIGRRWEHGDTAGANALRRAFERAFLPPGTQYRLVRLTYDPLARWRDGALSTAPLQSFIAGRP